jgi:hypothetical protein
MEPERGKVRQARGAKVARRRRGTYPAPWRPPVPSSNARTPANELRQPLDIERLAKLMAGIAVFLYVLGLLAINAYLFRLGVSDFTLVRTRFIYTGTLIAACAAWIYGFPAAVMFKMTDEYKNLTEPGIRKRIHAWRRVSRHDLGMSIVGIFGFPLLGLTTGLVVVSSGRIGDAIQSAIAIWLAAVISGYIIFRYVVILRSGWQRLPDRERLTVVILIGLVSFAVWLLYIATFMALAYPKIPEQFGGGRPRTIRILVKEDHVAGAREIGLWIPKHGHLSDPVELVYEGDKNYVLRAKDERLVQINKELTLGVVVGAK